MVSYGKSEGKVFAKEEAVEQATLLAIRDAGAESQLNLINRKRSSHGLGSWWKRKMVGRLNLYKHKLLLLILVCILTGCASSRVEEFRAAETGMALEEVGVAWEASFSDNETKRVHRLYGGFSERRQPTIASSPSKCLETILSVV